MNSKNGEKMQSKRDYRQEKIWEHYQNINPDSFEGAKPRLNDILKKIQKNTMEWPPAVLNIGCGNGYLEEEGKKRGMDIHSLDPDASTVERLFLKGIAARQGFIENIPFSDRYFDFVVASEVLEHLADEKRKAGLDEIDRILKPGGLFIGTVPYFEKMERNTVICPKCGEVFHRWGHEKAFTIEELAEELLRVFSLIKIEKKAFVAFKGQSAMGIIENIARIIMARLGARISSTNIYFIVQKKPK